MSKTASRALSLGDTLCLEPMKTVDACGAKIEKGEKALGFWLTLEMVLRDGQSRRARFFDRETAHREERSSYERFDKLEGTG